MTLEEIKQAILCTIEQQYKKMYLGSLIILKLEPIGYQVKFGLNNIDKPLVISAELPDTQFIKFMEKEIHDRRMDFVQYFEGYQTYPNSCCEFDSSCACNGKK